MKIWWQGHAQNGRSVMPVTVPAGVLLYHGNAENVWPVGTEWFAFEAEHSWLIAGKWFTGQASSMRTYVTARDINAWYFDGFSAGPGTTGSRDLQQVLVEGRVCDGPGRVCDDLSLGRELCDLALDNGFDAVIRLQGVLELMACRFEDSSAYEFVHSANATDRYDPRKQPPYRELGLSTFLASLEAHYHGDRRLKTHVEHLMSLYDEEDYPSLSDDNRLPVRKHRFFDLSADDLASARAELRQISYDRLSGNSSGQDWSMITQSVIDRYALRLGNLKTILINQTADQADPLAVVNKAWMASLSMLLPYVDVPTTLGSWPKPALPEAVLASLAVAESQCSAGFVPADIVGLNHQERRIKRAIAEVQARICGFLTGLLGQGLLSERHGTVPPGTLERWRADLESLMEWLAWPIWQRCDRQCAWDETCFLKMYPAMPRSQPLTPYDTIPSPQCAKAEDLVFCLPLQKFCKNETDMICCQADI